MQRNFDILITATAKGLNEIARQMNSTLQEPFLKGQTAAKSFDKSISSLTSTLAGLVTSYGVISFLKSSAEAFMGSERASNKMAQAMKNQGDYSKAALRDMEEYAAQLQETTAFSDEAALSAMANLKTYGMTNEEVKRATKVALDFAAAKKEEGMTVTKASELLGKAYVGSTGALSRYGIVLDESIGKGEKFNAVMEQLNQRFGGAAQADMNTFEGRLKNLNNTWDDMKESIGAVVVEIGTALIPTLKKVAGGLRDAAQGMELFFGVSAAGKSSHKRMALLDEIHEAEEAIKGFKKLIELEGGRGTELSILMGGGGSVSEAKKQIPLLEEKIRQLEKALMDLNAEMHKSEVAADAAANAMKKPAEAVLATKEQLGEFEKAATKGYGEAKKQAEDYAKKALEWDEKIKFARLSTEDKLRELGRKGLSEELTWKDKLYEAEEKMWAAREALRKGDFELAEKLAKQSEALYTDLAVEVKKTEGGKEVVVKSLETTKQIATDGITEVGRFVEELYGKQKTAAETAAAQWTATAEGIKKQLDEIAKERLANVKITLLGLETAAAAINALTKDETKYITIVTRKAAAAEPAATYEEQYAGGGKLAGYGGGDRIRSLLEAGEYVIRKEAVRKYGAALFHALNAGMLALPDLSSMLKARVGGLIGDFSLPPLPGGRLAFAEGGSVPFATMSGETMTIRFQAGNVEMPLKVQGSANVTRGMVKQFEKELIKMGLSTGK